MTHIYTKVELIDTVQVGKKYVALQGNEVRIVEVLDNGTARVGLHTVIGSFDVTVDTRHLQFLMQLPEEKKQQSILDNPYYEVEAARLQGKTVQVQRKTGHWCDWDQYDAPKYDAPADYYRIKPETKTVYRYQYEYEDAYGQIVSSRWTMDIVENVKPIKYIHENNQVFKKWIIEPECTPIEVEVK